MLESTLLSGGRMTMCPICQTQIQPNENCVTCPGCDQIHHQECWAEIGGCGTYGCQQAPNLEKPDATDVATTTGWGDTKNCPACGEEIKSIALRCRYCNTDFDSVDPMTSTDLRHRAKLESKISGVKKNIAILFALSLLGCTGPFVAIGTPIYFLPRRGEAARAGPLFVMMGWAAIAISWLFSLLLVAGLVSGSF